MQLRDVDLRSLGHSNQKLWPKVDLGEFHHVYPLEHLKSFATDRLWVYNAENFFVASFDHIKSAVPTENRNLKKVFSGHPNVHQLVNISFYRFRKLLSVALAGRVARH